MTECDRRTGKVGRTWAYTAKHGWPPQELEGPRVLLSASCDPSCSNAGHRARNLCLATAGSLRSDSLSGPEHACPAGDSTKSGAETG